MTKVYIVTKRDYDTGYSIFCRAFFKRVLAEDWIRGRRHPKEYCIETHKEQEDGSTIEIY